MGTQHALAPDHAQLQPGVVVQTGHQGDHAVDRKTHLVHRFAGLAQHLGQRQRRRFTQVQQVFAVRLGQQFDELVFDAYQRSVRVVLPAGQARALQVAAGDPISARRATQCGRRGSARRCANAHSGGMGC